MKLVYLSHGNIPSRWAHTFQVMKMAEALAARVERFELVTARGLLPGPGDRIDLEHWYGLRARLRVVRLPLHVRVGAEGFSFDASPRFDVAAAWYARLRRPDLVYTRSLGAGARCVAAGLATVIESHVAGDAPALCALRNLARRPALRLLVTVSEALREDWIAAGLPAEKLLVWPDAVDLERFAKLPAAPAARAALGLSREGPLAVYCGHFYPAKGVACLIDAARRLPKTSFHLVGGWPRDLAQAREQASGCENLRFAGFVANARVPEQLAAADVLVLPNSGRFPQARTTSPLKLFEYMAARRPIVATRIPALAGLLRHGENAWVVAPDSAEALADGIERVLSDPGLGARLAEQAWRDVQAYTWKRRSAEILAAAVAAGSPAR